MNQVVKEFIPKGKITLPFSKSYSHRAIITAFIANKGACLKNVNFCDDVKCTLNAIKQLGGKFNVNDNEITFFSSEKNYPNEIIIDVGSSASTLRFLLPFVCYHVKKVKFVGSKELFSRPLDIYEELFKRQNIDYIKGDNYLEINDKIQCEDFIVDCNKSSQFVTGYLFLISDINENHYIKLNNIESKPYIDMTLDVLKKFGVRFIIKDNLIVKNFAEFNYLNYEIEIDYSSLAYFACLGSLKGYVSCSNLNLLSYQGDKKIIEILMDMGAKIDISLDNITFYESLLRGIEIDLKNIIDLGPIIFVLCAFCYGKSIIKNVHRLEYKESNRLLNMINELKKANVDIAYIDDNVIINGKASYNGDYVFNSYNDHRIAMALSIFSVINHGKCTILNSECVNKSYPNFYNDLFSLGGLDE